MSRQRPHCGARDLKDDRAYGYDALRRLISATDSGKKATTYRYDPVGNRTATLREGKPLESASYDPANQLTGLLRTDGGVETSFRYDANGNLVARARGDDVTTFDYDAADRLRDRSDKRESALFAYDGDGDLVREQRVRLGDLSTRTLGHTLDVAGPLTQVLATSDGRDAATYLYGLGRLAAFGTKETRFFAADVRQSPRLLTDERGQVAAVRGFDAWGVPDPNSSVANASGPAALSELFGFTGERQDVRGSGLLYLRARWYDPSIGRFLTRDPASGARSDPRTQHPYMYSLTNPTSFVDRTGRSASGLFDGAGAYSFDGSALYANPRATPPVGSRRGTTAGQRLFYFLADSTRATGDFLAETAGPVLRQGAYDAASAWATTEENLNSDDPGRQANALGSIFVNTAGAVAGAIVLRAAAVVGLGAVASRFQSGRAVPPAPAPAPVIRNPVRPSQDFARVITPDQARRLAAGEPVLLSPRVGAQEAFITSSEALPRGLSSAEVARLAGIAEDRVGGIVRFHLDDLTGLATPIESSATGFVGRGLTSGGIPEFVIQNRVISELAYELEYIRMASGVAR